MQTLIGFGLGVLFIGGVAIGVHTGQYIPSAYMPYAIGGLLTIGLTCAVLAWRMR